MTREWGATGVGKHFPPRLSPARRKRIADELRSEDLDLRNLEPLLETLAVAVGRFDSRRHTREQSRPAAVRENLHAALRAAEKLNERLNALDGNSRYLIEEAANVSVLLLHERLGPIVRALFAASQLAKQYPVKGNLPENERLWLAADVLQALKQHLGLRSSKELEGSCLEPVLRLVLEEALQNRRKDLEAIARNLAAQAVRADQAVSSKDKIRIEHPDGSVEYQRPAWLLAGR